MSPAEHFSLSALWLAPLFGLFVVLLSCFIVGRAETWLARWACVCGLICVTV